jgi:dihydropteroate synthase
MSAQYTKKYLKTDSIFSRNSPPLIMGILNITADSFYDGGRYLSEKEYLIQAEKMIEGGADIIDVGAQSTRPGAVELSEAEEGGKLIEALKIIRKTFPEIMLSADTYRSHIAQQAAEAGADIINDIAGGTMDENMFKVIAQLNIPYVLMHIQGTPQNMQTNPQYKNVTVEVKHFFEHQVNTLNKMGANKIIIDPGFGFGKTLEHNYTLLQQLEQFQEIDKPLLVGISRKSMIWKLLNSTPEKALNGTSVINTIALMKGAKILRVHDVKEAKECVDIIQKMNEKTL